MDEATLVVAEARARFQEFGHRIQPLPVGFRGDSRR
jgi:hypothetical protein